MGWAFLRKPEPVWILLRPLIKCHFARLAFNESCSNSWGPVRIKHHIQQVDANEPHGHLPSYLHSGLVIGGACTTESVGNFLNLQNCFGEAFSRSLWLFCKRGSRVKINHIFFSSRKVRRLRARHVAWRNVSSSFMWSWTNPTEWQVWQVHLKPHHMILKINQLSNLWISEIQQNFLTSKSH